MLDDREDLVELVEALKDMLIEFAVFDVFNVLHAGDENDNTEMRAVLRQLSAIQSEAGCNMGVVHHFNKADAGSLTLHSICTTTPVRKHPMRRKRRTRN